MVLDKHKERKMSKDEFTFGPIWTFVPAQILDKGKSQSHLNNTQYWFKSSLGYKWMYNDDANKED